MDATQRENHRTGAGANTCALYTALPDASLRAYISHYWLCLYNGDTHYAIVPDGAVDVVCSVDTSQHRLDVFGTTTTRTLCPLVKGCHYVGIRFWPGQARHFMNVPADELTDAALTADEVLLPPLRSLCDEGGCLVSAMAALAAKAIATSDASNGAADVAIRPIWARLDALLLVHLQKLPPRFSCIDAVIRRMHAMPTDEHSWRVASLADLCGKSRRQFERHFLQAVGLSPKRFADVLRFQRALALLAQANWPLAQIAAELGYADQSHFSRAFARLYGQPPARARQNAAFVQDVQHFTAQNDSLLSH